ncbi:hypothetical protein CFE70_008855 [Pyrenophora teres f. teres 0-1]
MRERLTRELVGLQETTIDQPYSILHRLTLAKAYKDLGYPDLAAGDAYKALILIDEVVQEGEYHDDALEAARTDIITEQMRDVAINSEKGVMSLEDDDIATWAKTRWSKNAYDYHGTLSGHLQSYSENKGEALEDIDVEEYPDKGLVRREQYPWNHHEPNRFSTECLAFLNKELTNIAPMLEVRVAELPVLTTTDTANGSIPDTKYTKQLGLFAKDDIAPGEKVLEEKSLLTAISRLHDSYCDACSIPFSTSEGEKDAVISCEECDEIFFCSEECHDLAQDHYHPSICGVNLDQGKVPAREAADYLYTLLLFRALALAETQDLHPLELKEVRYIWGDYHGKDLGVAWQPGTSDHPSNPFGHIPQTLPFSFKNNILMPLHVLEKMDVNIFTQSHRYDTWIFNTLYAKFRGTASAQQGLDGRPEISAVHPMWCLANHSCDPNVAWEWRGSMRFWTREKMVDWKGRDPGKGPGLKKDEEVFGHYCDIRLPVKERREWAVGALGGECMCARCVWEEAAEQQQGGSH